MAERSIDHILLVRLSAMGDVAMTAPVVAALRRAYPGLRITVLTRAFFAPFFRDIPGVNVFAFDPAGAHKGVRGIVRLWRRLRPLRIDAVADLHDVLRTKLLRRLMRLSGAKVTVIDKGRSEKRLLTRKFRKHFRQLTHSVERYREVLLRLGLDVPVPGAAPHAPRPLPAEVARLAGEKVGPWIGVAPFARHRGKIYPTPLADELIALLAARYPRVFIFGGGPYEREFAECMQERHPGVISLIGRMSLGEELDTISALDAMVTMDSSSLHMASLVGTPAVSVWGATHPYAGFGGWGQSPRLAVQLDLPCRPCSVYGNKPCLRGDWQCMAGIAPQTIVDRVAVALESVPELDDIGSAEREGDPVDE